MCVAVMCPINTKVQRTQDVREFSETQSKFKISVLHPSPNKQGPFPLNQNLLLTQKENVIQRNLDNQRSLSYVFFVSLLSYMT